MTNDRSSPIRRHPDGALDIDFHRRRAARLRRAAPRRFWRAVFRVGATLMSRCRDRLALRTSAAEAASRMPPPAATRLG
jgi:hypothetical protein